MNISLIRIGLCNFMFRFPPKRLTLEVVAIVLVLRAVAILVSVSLKPSEDTFFLLPRERNVQENTTSSEIKSSDFKAIKEAKHHPSQSKCAEDEVCPILWRHAPMKQRSVSDFVKGNGLAHDDDSSPAVCKFLHIGVWSAHFPHAMQQLYRCYSYWLTRQKSPWILVYDDQIKMGRDSEFLTGFLDAVVRALNVTIVRNYNGPHVRLSRRASGPYAIQHPSHVRQLTYQLLKFGDPDFLQQQQRYEKDNHRRKPRIAILNRHKSRKLLNDHEIVAEIGGQPGGMAHSDVSIRYFENATFWDQLKFFRSVDLLISPHGAQLTGIAFMPECGAILELFSEGYYWPHFFSSLALDSGLYHGAWYLASPVGMINLTRRIEPKDRPTRDKVKSKQMCAPLVSMKEAIRNMIQYWVQCRDTASSPIAPSSPMF